MYTLITLDIGKIYLCMIKCHECSILQFYTYVFFRSIYY